MVLHSSKIGFVVIMLVQGTWLAGCSDEHSELLEQGQKIYQANCKVCHAQGINGAPILGNKKMWSSRAPQGLDVLVHHASEGYGLMPAKGGNDDLTTEELSSAVQYMLSQLQ